VIGEAVEAVEEADSVINKCDVQGRGA
jgi:hypothetical protein